MISAAAGEVDDDVDEVGADVVFGHLAVCEQGEEGVGRARGPLRYSTGDHLVWSRATAAG